MSKEEKLFKKFQFDEKKKELFTVLRKKIPKEVENEILACIILQKKTQEKCEGACSQIMELVEQFGKSKISQRFVRLLLKEVIFFPPKLKSKSGRHVFIIRVMKLFTHPHLTKEDRLTFIMQCFNFYLKNYPTLSIEGVILFFDVSDVGFDAVGKIDFGLLRDFYRVIQKIPLRPKYMLVYKPPRLFDWSLTVVKTFMSKKMGNRIQRVYNRSDLEKYIDKKRIPREYGGNTKYNHHVILRRILPDYEVMIRGHVDRQKKIRKIKQNKRERKRDKKPRELDDVKIKIKIEDKSKKKNKKKRRKKKTDSNKPKHDKKVKIVDGKTVVVKKKRRRKKKKKGGKVEVLIDKGRKKKGVFNKEGKKLTTKRKKIGKIVSNMVVRVRKRVVREEKIRLAKLKFMREEHVDFGDEIGNETKMEEKIEEKIVFSEQKVKDNLNLKENVGDILDDLLEKIEDKPESEPEEEQKNPEPEHEKKIEEIINKPEKIIESVGVKHEFENENGKVAADEIMGEVMNKVEEKAVEREEISVIVTDMVDMVVDEKESEQVKIEVPQSADDKMEIQKKVEEIVNVVQKRVNE